MVEYRWYSNGKGRSVYRPVPVERGERSNLPCPAISIDTIEPTISQADGKEYTSKAALRATYRAENNPQGINYIEIGNEPLPAFTPPKRDNMKALEAIERAESDVSAGRAPEIGTINPNEIDLLKVI